MILQEIVSYQIVYGITNFVLAVLFFILLFASIFISRWSEAKDNFTLLIVGIAGSVLSTLLTCVCFVESTILIKALVAPRLVILEYLEGLL